MQRSGFASASSRSVGEAVDRVLGEPGRPLDAGISHRLGGALGHNFGRVRVHDGDGAARSANLLSAHAWTVGSHVTFASGRYAPDTEDGERLLAHELTHVAQQRSTPSPAGLVVDDDPGAEREAQAAVRAIVFGARRPAMPALHPAPPAPEGTIIRRAAADAGVPVVDAGVPAVDAGTPGACALTTYTGSNFVGNAVMADIEFVDSLDAINGHAAANAVDVSVTSSFRTTRSCPERSSRRRRCPTTWAGTRLT